MSNIEKKGRSLRPAEQVAGDDRKALGTEEEGEVCGVRGGQESAGEDPEAGL